MNDFVIVLIVIHFFLFVYTFRFQRTTLGLSREHLGQGTSKYQQILTPTWMGILGWFQTILYVSAIISVFFVYGWLFAVGYILISQVGFTLVDGITPIPSYTHCFKTIKNHLLKEIHLTNDEEMKNGLRKVLVQVVASEKKALEEKK